MLSPATDWMSDIVGKGFGLLPSSSFTATIPFDLVGLAVVVVAIVVELLTRGAKLRLVVAPVGGGDEGGWES